MNDSRQSNCHYHRGTSGKSGMDCTTRTGCDTVSGRLGYSIDNLMIRLKPAAGWRAFSLGNIS